MAQAPTIATALASPTMSIDIPKARGGAGENHAGYHHDGKPAAVLLTPPNSISPDLPAYGVGVGVQSPPPMDIKDEMDAQDSGEDAGAQEIGHPPEPSGTPLSKTNLSGLDASAAITPAMLAKHHLPGIMLGNGPRPIRYVMGELTQLVPGFARIPPAKARRLVVAALESRHGGGIDGRVAFCKTGWGRWDAHIKGSSKDSGVGSFNDNRLSPSRSEQSSYAMSNGDSGVHMSSRRRASGHRDHYSRGSWTASDLREEDETGMDMDVPENEADKMSMDEVLMDDDGSSSTNEETDDEDWAAIGPEALREASKPRRDAPRTNYNALCIPIRPPGRSWSRRPSGMTQRSMHSTSLPAQSSWGRVTGPGISPATATPEETAAVAALMSLGSM